MISFFFPRSIRRGRVLFLYATKRGGIRKKVVVPFSPYPRGEGVERNLHRLEQGDGRKGEFFSRSAVPETVL